VVAHEDQDFNGTLVNLFSCLLSLSLKTKRRLIKDITLLSAYHSKFLKAEIMETEEMAVNNNYDKQLIVPLNFSPTWISWTFLKAYIK
jgi:hypothetical protein